MFRDIGEIRGEGYALDNLGEAYLSLGQVAPAIGALERALELRDSAGDRFDAADTLGRLVRAHVASQQPERARAYLRRALLIYEELGDDAQASAVRARFHGLAT
jgi:tetratricopeptide (TPR) repeat protein